MSFTHQIDSLQFYIPENFSLPNIILLEEFLIKMHEKIEKKNLVHV